MVSLRRGTYVFPFFMSRAERENVKILLIEDNILLRNLIESQLAMLGHNTIIAENKEQVKMR